MNDMASIRKTRPTVLSGSLAATGLTGSAGGEAFEDGFFCGKQKF
jgi:hypothetical protein